MYLNFGDFNSNATGLVPTHVEQSLPNEVQDFHANSAAAQCSSVDAQLIESAERALRGTGYPQLFLVHVRAFHGVVTLRGRVTTYHQKQMAQATAQQVEGAERVINEIEVTSIMR